MSPRQEPSHQRLDRSRARYVLVKNRPDAGTTKYFLNLDSRRTCLLHFQTTKMASRQRLDQYSRSPSDAVDLLGPDQSPKTLDCCGRQHTSSQLVSAQESPNLALQDNSSNLAPVVSLLMVDCLGSEATPCALEQHSRGPAQAKLALGPAAAPPGLNQDC